MCCTIVNVVSGVSELYMIFMYITYCYVRLCTARARDLGVSVKRVTFIIDFSGSLVFFPLRFRFRFEPQKTVSRVHHMSFFYFYISKNDINQHPCTRTSCFTPAVCHRHDGGDHCDVKSFPRRDFPRRPRTMVGWVGVECFFRIKRLLGITSFIIRMGVFFFIYTFPVYFVV